MRASTRQDKALPYGHTPAELFDSLEENGKPQVLFDTSDGTWRAEIGDEEFVGYGMTPAEAVDAALDQALAAIPSSTRVVR